MVLGFLLYEAVDLAWNFGGMTYRGAKNIYNWYYEVPTADDIEIKKLSEIDKRMRAAFPNKFTQAEEPVTTERNDGSSSPSQVVAGGSRSSPNPKKVKLSQEDVRLANKWGIPLEQYAQEKLKATSAEGEYTTINMQRGG